MSIFAELKAGMITEDEAREALKWELAEEQEEEEEAEEEE